MRDLDLPLLPSPSVTVRFDGLIIMSYDKEKRLCEAGTLTRVAGHELRITVRKNGDPDVLWPKKKSEWNGSHRKVREIAPLWLYVDSGKGLSEDEYSAELHKPDNPSGFLSFGRVFSFENPPLYSHPLNYKREVLSSLYIAQGVFYSATSEPHNLYEVPPNKGIDQATLSSLEEYDYSTRVAADIASNSDPTAKRSIVLKSEKTEEPIFNIQIQEGTYYIIDVENVPQKEHHDHFDVRDHFLKYYEAISIGRLEKKYFIKTLKGGGTGRDSPPCNVVQADLFD